jgi:hypothetical protein
MQRKPPPFTVTWEWVTPVAYFALLVQEAFGGAPEWFVLIVLGAFCWDFVRDMSS